MKHNSNDIEFETLNVQLNDEEKLNAYKRIHDAYTPSWFPRICGSFLVLCGNYVYGHEPSYLKFRAVEVIARVPYHSWASVSFTLMTMFYADEKRAMQLSKIKKYAMLASDNETMHVVVISALSREEKHVGFVRFTLIPIVFSFFYFWISYIVYSIRPRWSLEINYLFEQHAFDSYSCFLEMYGEALKNKPINNAYLAWYGRHPHNQYEFFRSVRNDEIIHRNSSIEDIIVS
jgi:ubiquinol oxidase